jgi:hypothetical protein
MYAECLLDTLKGRAYLEDRGTGVRVIWKWIVKKQGVRIQTGLIRFRIESSHGLL